MAKQPQLSPEKYILTKARSLPIHKCYVSLDWEEADKANVIVARRHVNGNFTVGFYLVDLLCLGVKDTFFMFNVSEDELNEALETQGLDVEEVDYDLAHNIVYAGLGFAEEFHIKPHKDFSLTKFILKEDNEEVPIIEIPVGDENGNPRLEVTASYNYGPVLSKLKQYAGEGNYTFYIVDEEEEFDEDDDDFDEDDFDDDELDDDDEEFFDFHIASTMETDELEDMVDDNSENGPDRLIADIELLLRELDEMENGVIEDLEVIKKKKDYLAYEKKTDQWQKDYENSADKLDEVFPEVRSLGLNENDLDPDDLMQEFLKLLERYKTDDTVSYMIVSAIPAYVSISKFDLLERDFKDYTPAVQLFIAAYATLTRDEPGAQYNFILDANTVDMAYPFNRLIHGMHYKLFWLLKAIQAIKRNDKEKLFYYHNFLRVTGTGGHMKYLYGALLMGWLKKYMGADIEEESEELT